TALPSTNPVVDLFANVNQAPASEETASGKTTEDGPSSPSVEQETNAEQSNPVNDETTVPLTVTPEVEDTTEAPAPETTVPPPTASAAQQADNEKPSDDEEKTTVAPDETTVAPGVQETTVAPEGDEERPFDKTIEEWLARRRERAQPRPTPSPTETTTMYVPHIFDLA
ncbi:hypothetical protein PFISCL1PPCAC_25807, partial [Pristionchus fissidentatus]